MDDITVQILKDIRANTRDVSDRLDQTNARLDSLREELSRRIVESELRTATAMTDLAGSVREVAQILRAQHDLRPRVERCEAEIAELKKHLPAA